MRLVFAGTPAFAATVLSRLSSVHEIAVVLTRPAKGAGRGRREKETEVALEARRLGIPVESPGNPNAAESVEILRQALPEAVLVVSFGRILSREFLAASPRGCFNLHASLLPEYRGASPVQAALREGRTATGLTVIRMTARMDAGPIVGSCDLSIRPGETAGELLCRMAPLGADLVLDILAGLEAGGVVETPQDEGRATYCKPITKSEGEVDWTLPAPRIVDHFRAMSPWPGAYTWLHGAARTVRVMLTRIVEGGALHPAGEPPGTILGTSDEGIEVGCGAAGSVRVLELQPEGKRPMSAAEFLRGNRTESGDRFAGRIG